MANLRVFNYSFLLSFIVLKLFFIIDNSSNEIISSFHIVF